MFPQRPTSASSRWRRALRSALAFATLDALVAATGAARNHPHDHRAALPARPRRPGQIPAAPQPCAAAVRRERMPNRAARSRHHP